MPRTKYFSGSMLPRSLQLSTLNLTSSLAFNSIKVWFKLCWSNKQKRFPRPIFAMKASRFYLLDGMMVAQALSSVFSFQNGWINSAISVSVNRRNSSVIGPLVTTLLNPVGSPVEASTLKIISFFLMSICRLLSLSLSSLFLRARSLSAQQSATKSWNLQPYGC